MFMRLFPDRHADDMEPQGSTDLEHIQVIKKVGGKLTDSYLDEGEWACQFYLQRSIHIVCRIHSRQDNCREFPKTDGKC